MLLSPRPFYRWKSFWLGLLILCFLGWAWADSFWRPFQVTRFQPPDYYQAFHLDGHIFLRRGDSGPRAAGETWWSGSLKNAPSATDLKVRWHLEHQDYLAIPHAAIVSLFALGLAAVIAWRNRRWKRLLSEMTGTTGTP